MTQEIVPMSTGIKAMRTRLAASSKYTNSTTYLAPSYFLFQLLRSFFLAFMSRIDSDATICDQILYFMPRQLIPGSILKQLFLTPWIEIMLIERNHITNFLSSHIDDFYRGSSCYAPIWQDTWGNSGWKQLSGLLLVIGEWVGVHLESVLDQKVFHVWSLSSFSSQY